MYEFEATIHWLNNPYPIHFYSYTSTVSDYLFWEHPEKLPKDLVDLFQKIKEKAIDKGAKWDNKVVVECLIDGFPHNLFFGYIDGYLALGFSVLTEKWAKKYNLGA